MAFVTSTTIEIVGDATLSKELLKQCASEETDGVIRLEKVTAYVNAESPWSAEIGIRQAGTSEIDAVVWFDMTVFELEHVASVLRAYQAKAREENAHAGETGGVL